jgi:23S rRNA (adenine2030-N6)-methyltransferase
MLSYRHAFHAGNHADVLKHAVLVQVLEYLKQKDKPLLFVDTHAGAGLYRLDSPWAQKNREFDAGIGRLLECQPLPGELDAYLDLIKSLNPNRRLQRYPGSPWLAVQLLRAQDQARLFELHPAEFEALESLSRGDRRVKVERQDGFQALPALLPPAQRRALVLIDPPYEVKQDYLSVVSALQAAWRRFVAGVYLLWYPVVRRASIDRLERDLKASGLRDVLLAELAVAPASRGGMQASGLILVNPPWTLKAQLQTLLPFLAGTLGQDGQGSYRLEVLVEE